MVWLGPYKQVLESHRDSSLKAAYSDVEASALAQAIVANAIPHAKSLFGFDQPEHRYFPVISKWKTWVMGKVNDEGRSSLRIQQFDRGEFQFSGRAA
jgi:hypothetical protein